MVDLVENFEAGPEGASLLATNSIFETISGNPTSALYTANAALFGSFGMRYNHANNLRWANVSVPPGGSAFYRYYIRVLQPPSSNSAQCAVFGGGTNRAQISYRSDGAISLRSPATVRATTSGSYVGKWMRIEWDLVGDTQTLRVFFDDNVHGTTPTETISGPIQVANSIDTLRFGSSVADTWQYDADGLALSTTSPPPRFYVPPSGPTVAADCYVWDGTALVPVDPYLWDGTKLNQVDLTNIT